MKLCGASAAIDHGFGLFGLPGLEQEQITRSGASFHGPPAAFGLRRRFLDNRHDFAEVLAAGGTHDDVLANLNIRHSGSIEMVDLADFGETYTDNIWVHRGELYRRK